MMAGSETARHCRGRRWKTLCAATLLTSILAVPAAAKVKDWQITPTSAESLIVISAQSQTFSDQDLVFSREGQSSYGGRYTLRIKAGDAAPFVARAVVPGTYRLRPAAKLVELLW